jgi:5-formaminoimidazole-4-carboxamide-1-beta-D-ribofuranosyl 5'-monophosphate synthetase
MDDNKIETVNFDGLEYKIEDLTPRTLEGFNMLVKLQQEIAKVSYELRINQAAQKQISEELKVAIREDKIKHVEKDEE